MTEKVVAFDLDGTLINSAPDITAALNKVLIKNNGKEVSINDVYKLVGNGAKALIIDSFNKQNMKISNIDKLTKGFLLEYRECYKNKTSLFDNVLETIKQLKKLDFKLILVSNKPQFYVIKLLKHFKLSSFFESISGGDTYPYRKPDPRHIFSTLEDAGINQKCRGVFIGDSKYDYICAENIDWPCLLYSKGYSDIDINTLGARKIFDNYINLPDLILDSFTNYNYKN
jgi:phosphoglycolate phosphatase